MINIENAETQEPKPSFEHEQDHVPDEQGGMIIQGFLKIHDPETGKVIVQGRA